MPQLSSPKSPTPPPETLTNKTVQLRKWHPSDVEALYTAVNTSIPELSKWMPWASKGYSRTDAQCFIDFTTHAWTINAQYDYAILFNGDISGSCGLMKRDDIPHGMEIGYWLVTAATGKGLVTSATEVLARVAFEMGAEFVQIRHDEGNGKSRAVPERLGFELLGRRVLKGIGEQVVWHLDNPAMKALEERSKSL